KRSPEPVLFQAYSATSPSIELTTYAQGFCGQSQPSPYGTAIAFGSYPDCPSKHRYDLRDAFGTGLGPTEQIASDEAAKNCERALTRYYRDYPQLRQARLQCVTTAKKCLIKR